MGINFPASPVVGDLYPVPPQAGVPQYKWDGTVWVANVEQPLTYVKRTGDTMTGILALSGNPVAALDAAPRQYVDAVKAYSETTDRRRNRVVNAAMLFSQEFGNVLFNPTTGSSYFIADQWQAISATAPGTIQMQNVIASTPNGSICRLKILVGTAKASLAAADYVGFSQPIEGARISDFKWGAAGARQVILRFGFKAPAGTYSICLLNAAGNRSYLANFTISAGQANTDTEQTFVIPGDTTGAWLVTNALSLYLRVMLCAGATYTGPAGWSSGAVFVTASNTNFMATAGNTAELFDVGLYLDAEAVGIAPKWEMPDPAADIALCQRYFQNVYIVVWFGYAAGLNTTVGQTVSFPTMRVGPSAVMGNPASNNVGTVTISGTYPNVLHIYGTAAAAGQGYFQNTTTLTARL